MLGGRNSFQRLQSHTGIHEVLCFMQVYCNLRCSYYRYFYILFVSLCLGDLLIMEAKDKVCFIGAQYCFYTQFGRLHNVAAKLWQNALLCVVVTQVSRSGISVSVIEG